MNSEIASTLRFMPNVLGFLGGMAEPTPVRQVEVNRLLGNVEDSVLEEVQDIPYTVGESVKVTDGPFSRFPWYHRRGEYREAQVEGNGNDFGRQNPLELSFMQVAKKNSVVTDTILL